MIQVDTVISVKFNGNQEVVIMGKIPIPGSTRHQIYPLAVAESGRYYLGNVESNIEGQITMNITQPTDQDFEGETVSLTENNAFVRFREGDIENLIIYSDEGIPPEMNENTSPNIAATLKYTRRKKRSRNIKKKKDLEIQTVEDQTVEDQTVEDQTVEVILGT